MLQGTRFPILCISDLSQSAALPTYIISFYLGLLYIIFSSHSFIRLSKVPLTSTKSDSLLFNSFFISSFATINLFLSSSSSRSICRSSCIRVLYFPSSVSFSIKQLCHPFCSILPSTLIHSNRLTNIALIHLISS